MILRGRLPGVKAVGRLDVRHDGIPRNAAVTYLLDDDPDRFEEHALYQQRALAWKETGS